MKNKLVLKKLKFLALVIVRFPKSQYFISLANNITIEMNVNIYYISIL